MNPARRALVESALHAATRALPPPSEIEDAISGKFFSALSDEALCRLPGSSREAACEIVALVKEAVSTVRKRRGNSGWRQDAIRLFALADARVQTLDCESASAHVAPRLFAARAYLFYAERRWTEAHVEARKANEAALALIAHGQTWMHAHRIQLVHNLARLQLARDRLDLALRTTDWLVDHLLGKTTPVEPMTGPWSPGMLDGCPCELIAAHAYLARGEAAYWVYRNTGAHRRPITFCDHARISAPGRDDRKTR